MKLSELVNHVGDENVMIQWLHSCTIKTDAKPDHVEVTFGTNAISIEEIAAQVMCGDTSKNVGLVLWLPFSRLPNDLQSKLRPKPKRNRPKPKKNRSSR